MIHIWARFQLIRDKDILAQTGPGDNLVNNIADVPIQSDLQVPSQSKWHKAYLNDTIRVNSHISRVQREQCCASNKTRMPGKHQIICLNDMLSKRHI